MTIHIPFQGLFLGRSIRTYALVVKAGRSESGDTFNSCRVLKLFTPHDHFVWHRASHSTESALIYCCNLYNFFSNFVIGDLTLIGF